MENENYIKGKLEIEIAGRKIEVRVIETPSNQHNYMVQRVYAKFIDNKKPIDLKLQKENILNYAEKTNPSKEDLEAVKRVIEKIPDENIY